MDSEQELVVVFITSASESEAHSLARMLVEKRLAACVNTFHNVHSLFWWQGKVDSAHEVLLIVKTRAALLPNLVESVKKAHSYTVPEIIALPIIGGNPDYLKWVVDETST
ncbi:MAG: divalent-cation tolerance protein CutA [Dehalococcoidia bacterium]|nr:divalent-cation tolerance protein CutA [Dehalococcoidia bacterium]